MARRTRVRPEVVSVPKEKSQDFVHVPPARLNAVQFHDHVHPNQLAIPGMEHMAHPWAEHLKRGFMLQFDTHGGTHTLSAWDVSDPKWPSEAANLDWARAHRTHPGEIDHVINYQAGGRETHGAGVAKGLAGALLHSAHYWDFGQETVPIHSPVRTDAGEHFASKYRPDLKPDIHRRLGGHHSEDRVYTTPGKPPGEGPKWPNVPSVYHPFQQEAAAAERQHAETVSKKIKPILKGQGTLF